MERLTVQYAPEKKTVAGKLVTQVVERLFKLDETCTIEYVADDKYAGRFRGKMIVPSVGDLSEYLLSQKLVKPYSGGVRSWEGAELDAIRDLCLRWLETKFLERIK
jgi:hypothetical protein